MEHEVLQEFKMESSHEYWLDCYRIALDFGPVIAEKAMASITNERQTLKSTQTV